jgi:hypothetical protein
VDVNDDKETLQLNRDGMKQVLLCFVVTPSLKYHVRFNHPPNFQSRMYVKISRVFMHPKRKKVVVGFHTAQTLK